MNALVPVPTPSAKERKLALRRARREVSTYFAPSADTDQKAAAARSWARRWLIVSFALVVALPTLAAAWYFAFIASDVYVSEMRLTVRNPADVSQLGVDAIPSLGKLKLSVPKSSAQDSYIVLDYIRGKAIVDDIGGESFLKSIYSRDEIDWISRLSPNASAEKTFRYWRNHIDTEHSATSGLVAVKIFAFSPEEARTIGTRILEASEKLLNQISIRNRHDAVDHARAEVETTARMLEAARAALTKYRNDNSTIDPARKGQEIGKLIADLTLQKLQIQASSAGYGDSLSPNAPAARTTKAKIDEIDRKISELKSELTSQNEAGDSIPKELNEFERLKLDQESADKLHQMAVLALDRTRQDAERQLLYVAPVMSPTLPEKALYPERAWSTFMVGIALLVLWGIGVAFVGTVYDHLD
jgi:capsular polysaccharide transport system permease protein